MGALLTAFQARIPAQRRIDLTNVDSESASTENTTVSGAAETDAANEFLFKTGLAFDSTNSEHLTVGVKGLLHFLYDYRGLPKSPAAQAAQKAWEDACDSFARTRGALAWIQPQTDSLLNPTRDVSGGLPYFDRLNMGDLVPPSPSSSDSSDWRTSGA